MLLIVHMEVRLPLIHMCNYDNSKYMNAQVIANTADRKEKSQFYLLLKMLQKSDQNEKCMQVTHCIPFTSYQITKPKHIHLSMCVCVSTLAHNHIQSNTHTFVNVHGPTTAKYVTRNNFCSIQTFVLVQFNILILLIHTSIGFDISDIFG